MFTFKNRFGEEFDVFIDMGTAARLARWDFSAVTDVKINLFQYDQKLIETLLQNAGVLTALAYAICKPQVDEKYKDTPDSGDEINQRELKFLSGFDGQTIEAAKEAMFKSLANFFQPQATVIWSAFDRLRRTEKRIAAKAMEKDEEIMKMIEQKEDEVIAQAMNRLHNLTPEDFITRDGTTWQP